MRPQKSSAVVASSAVIAAVLATAAMASCGDSGDPKGNGQKDCSVSDQIGCPSGQFCENVQNAKPACFDALVIHGSITDIADGSPIADARVLAFDENGAVLSSAIRSNPDGSYNLAVPADRDSSGFPLSKKVTLRVDAADYQGFPEPPRLGTQFDLSDAKGTTDLVVSSDGTDVSLVHLQSSFGFGAVSGTIDSDTPGGTLVVAGNETGVADTDGDFVVFNVPPGDIKVYALEKGRNFDIQASVVSSGMQTKGVTIEGNKTPTSSVTGSVEIANAKAGATTTVQLMLEDTFNADLNWGDPVSGLFATGVSGKFTIDGVPDGKYVVVAAFENDGLVADPNTIETPAVAHVIVDGGNVTADPLRVVGAIDVISPGANDIEPVTGVPKLSWAADANATAYQVQVIDALGNKVWDAMSALPTGSGAPSIDYGGPTLKTGMLYQFRVTSLVGKTPRSSTEDLKGVFLYQ